MIPMVLFSKKDFKSLFLTTMLPEAAYTRC